MEERASRRGICGLYCCSVFCSSSFCLQLSISLRLRPQASYTDVGASKHDLSLIDCIRRRFQIPLNKSNPKHLEWLKRYWCSIQREEFPGPVHDSWKLLGFQNKDASSDFRSVGAYGLVLLTKFMESHSSYARIARDDDYPFSACSISAIHAVRVLLRLEAPSQQFRQTASPLALQGILALLLAHCYAQSTSPRNPTYLSTSTEWETEDVVMEALCSAAIQLMHVCWSSIKRTDPQVNLLGFGRVYPMMMTRLDQCLHNVDSILDIERNVSVHLQELSE